MTPRSHSSDDACSGFRRNRAGGSESGEPFDANPGAFAERLAGVTVGLELLEDRDQLGHDAVVGDIVLELEAEPVADGAAAQEDGVGARPRLTVGPTCADRPTRPISAL